MLKNTLTVFKLTSLGNSCCVLLPDQYRHLSEEGIDLALFSKWVLDKNLGVGADNLLAVVEERDVDKGRKEGKVEGYNPDGSDVGMCGNGVRCVAFLLSCLEEDNRTSIPYLFTLGKREVEAVVLREEGRVAINLGAPFFYPDGVPFNREKAEKINFTFNVGTTSFNFLPVGMGNPHCVIEVDSLDDTPVSHLGPLFERDPVFPERTNVEFVEVNPPYRVRIWERGVGETLASGSGAAAVYAALARNKRIREGEEVEISMPGGVMVVWMDEECIWTEAPVLLIAAIELSLLNFPGLQRE